MLKRAMGIVAFCIGAVLVYALIQPDTFRVERSTSIKAPPDKVFALINEFKAWPDWSPWEKLDPAMKRTYGATTAGNGATYSWEGNREVGQGGMQIMETTPASRVAIKIDFIKPFQAQNTVEFTLAPEAGSTKVTWAMFGPANFMTKLMGVFVSMDKMIGKDFETGLANMKAVAEK